MPKILHFTFFKFWTPFLKGRAYTFSTSQPPQSDTFLHVAFFYSQTCFKHLFFTAQKFPIPFRRHSDIIPKGYYGKKEQKKTHAEKLFCSINCINFGILNGCYFRIFGFICSHAMFIHLTKAEVLFGVLQCFFYLCRNFDLRPIPLLCINQTA